MKKYLYIIAAAILFAAGFWAGRATMPTKEVVRYITLPAVRGSLSSFELEPISETFTGPLKFILMFKELPADKGKPSAQSPTPAADQPQPLTAEALPGRVIDTLASYRATVEDWNKRRTYAKELFDNKEIGKFTFTAAVQYNDLQSFDYEFIPVAKEISQVRTYRWQPFASVGYNTFDQGEVGIGTFYKNVGGQLRVIRDFKGERNAAGATLMIKF